MKITTKEVKTTKEVTTINHYQFKIQVVQDGDVIFSQNYSTALEAVAVFDLFKDYGSARYQREVLLAEPNGAIHAKTFAAPIAVAIR